MRTRSTRASSSTKLPKATTTTKPQPQPPSPNDKQPVDDGFCFACGRHSQIGLHLHFAVDVAGIAVARTTLGAQFQGWQGVAHGGIVAMLLDEAMAYAASGVGWRGVTAELTTRFRKPVPTQREVVVRGEVAWQKQRVIGLTATVHDGDGTLLAQAEGKFVGRTRIEPGTLGVD